MSGKVSHAYLFCGTRGTGKTSIARILARAVNCQNPQDGNPCNTCDTCTSIFAERNLNVVEIDAASNNGVENIRDLRDEVKYQPTQGKYKVYIIDEVHMLSTSAFNALLKTLEEPPAHVIFILATTDSQKLPATILSRCQRYDFRRIAANDIITTLQKYLHEQNVEYEEKALDYIAYHSDGAMRDALSLLDQSLSLGGSKLTYDQVLDMLGAVDRSRLFEFTDALATCNSVSVLAVIEQAMDGGRDASQFVADLVRHFRDILVAGLVTDPSTADFSAEIAASLQEQGKRVTSQLIMEYIHAFSETLREMRFAPHARTALEVCALRVCVPKVVTDAYVTVQAVPAVAEKSTMHVEKSQPRKILSDVTTDILDKIAHGWDDMCKNFPNPMRSMCAQCGMVNNNGKLEIITNSETIKNILKPKEATIRESIADKFQLSTPPNLAFVVQEAYNKEAKKIATQTETSKSVQSEKYVEPEPLLEQQSLSESWDVPKTGPEQQPVPLGTSPDNDWDSLVSSAPSTDEEDWNAIGAEMTSDDEW